MSGAEVQKPGATPDEAVQLLRAAYGIAGTVRPLAGERDATFVVEAEAGHYVLKVAPAGEDRALLDLEVATLEHLAVRGTGLRLPRVVPTVEGEPVVRWTAGTGEVHHVRLLDWVPGTPWAAIRPHTAELRGSLGAAVGALTRGLAGFAHPAARHDFIWDLTRLDRVLSLTAAVNDEERRAHLESVLETGIAIGSLLSDLPSGVLYHDANDLNVLVDGPDARNRSVVGFVDFGDLLAGPLIIDLAIAIAYGVMGMADPLSAAAEIVAGCNAVRPLSAPEIAVLFPLVRARLAVSVTLAAARRAPGVGNAYLTVSERPAWSLLDRLARVPERLAEYTFRAACGLEPCPLSARVRAWLDGQAATFRPVLGEDVAMDRASLIDLSIESADYGTLADVDDVETTTRAIEARMAAAGARVGVGRWNEVRCLYRAEPFRVAGNERDEFRTVHVGLDLFVSAGTAVHAPLDGTVRGLRDNAGRFDYGPTILLEHSVRDASGDFTFHTLFGHLGRESLQAFRIGDTVRAGARIGWVGGSDVNGGWPPHLHVQLVCDLLGHEAEFPGVAGIRDRDVWLSLSPDPGRLAGVTADLYPSASRDADRLLAARRARIGPSLSLAYARPLHLVRGFLQTLFDADGQPWLDCVNNVAHVGHCNPHVVRAAAGQKAVLETNTRYLHAHLVRLAERLCARLPRPLDVCFFVNSGSEANELALRLARAATGRHGVVVLDVGYHGNTTTLVDVSPYKHDGPGGTGAPPWVRKIPLPDPYRGVHAGDPDAGRKYAAHVRRAAGTLRENGTEAGAFLAESIVSCGGQVVPPDGFLAAAYAHAREAGAVCIADEVQTGLGRVGDAFWAFELEGVVPDIVTIGKPFGNGHPLAAVVTTREIADAFANGMEYFNTFGGNTVSCAVGLAVLDVIEREGLQENARIVGSHLLENLRALQSGHPLIGDVRGRGLFLGFELVRDRERREPAPEAAAWLIERACAKGVLLSTDGPDRNVIKIKPPLCFTVRDADRLASVLDDVLGEDFFVRVTRQPTGPDRERPATSGTAG